MYVCMCACVDAALHVHVWPPQLACGPSTGGRRGGTHGCRHRGRGCGCAVVAVDPAVRLVHHVLGLPLGLTAQLALPLPFVVFVLVLAELRGLSLELVQVVVLLFPDQFVLYLNYTLTVVVQVVAQELEFAFA